MAYITLSSNKVSQNLSYEFNLKNKLKFLFKNGPVNHEHFNEFNISPENVNYLKDKLSALDELSNRKSTLNEEVPSEKNNEDNQYEKDKNKTLQLENIEGLLLNQLRILSSTYSISKKLHITQNTHTIQHSRDPSPIDMIKKGLSESVSGLDSQRVKRTPSFLLDKRSENRSENTTKNRTNLVLTEKTRTLPLERNIVVKSGIKELTKELIKEELVGVDTLSAETVHLECNKSNHISDVRTVQDGNNIFHSEENKNSIDFKEAKDNNSVFLNKKTVEHKKEINVDNGNNIPTHFQIPQLNTLVILPTTISKIVEVPSWNILHRKVSKATQPPSITYVFKQWGSDIHQMKINLIDNQIKLIASTGRLYQSSLEYINQYQGRYSLALTADNKNIHWHINSVDAALDKENEKE